MEICCKHQQDICAKQVSLQNDIMDYYNNPNSAKHFFSITKTHPFINGVGEEVGQACAVT